MGCFDSVVTKCPNCGKDIKIAMPMKMDYIHMFVLKV